MASALLMAWSTNEQFSSMMRSDMLLNYALGNKSMGTAESWTKEDLRHGGERWQFALFVYSSATGKKNKAHQLEASTVPWMGFFLSQAHAAAQEPEARASIVFSEVWLQDYIIDHLDDPAFRDLRDRAGSEREGAVMRMATAAPLRDDLAAPFLSGLENATQGDTAKQVVTLRKILDIAPGHRGALWKLGHLLQKTTGHEQEGVEMIQKAITLGVGRVYPIKNQELHE
jgi:hypothetical protein